MYYETHSSLFCEFILYPHTLLLIFFFFFNTFTFQRYNKNEFYNNYWLTHYNIFNEFVFHFKRNPYTTERIIRWDSLLLSRSIRTIWPQIINRDYSNFSHLKCLRFSVENSQVELNLTRTKRVKLNSTYHWRLINILLSQHTYRTITHVTRRCLKANLLWPLYILCDYVFNDLETLPPLVSFEYLIGRWIIIIFFFVNNSVCNKLCIVMLILINVKWALDDTLYFFAFIHFPNELFFSSYKLSN